MNEYDELSAALTAYIERIAPTDELQRDDYFAMGVMRSMIVTTAMHNDKFRATFDKDFRDSQVQA